MSEMTETEKMALRNQVANIDWEAENDTEGRMVISKLNIVIDTLASEAGKLEAASDKLQQGLKTESDEEDMDYALDEISSNIAFILEYFDEIRFKLF